MGSFNYGSGLWPGGMTLPSSDIGYCQEFNSASGNLSNTSGMVYPIAVPRIDPGATSGTAGNQYILPYSAQVFSAALSGIQLEYSSRNATEPTFYAYFDASGTVKAEVSGYRDLLSMPLANFHYLIEDVYTAISGLVLMDNWNDDMQDYMRRVFDYRTLLSDVPSENRLQDNVEYFNIASGTNLIINPLTRARAGEFPLSLDDVRYLGSKWGINPNGSRNYGSSEFSGSGIAAGGSGTRDPHFQQATFMGHFDWLAQSIMWRPPVVESFSKGTEGSEQSFLHLNRKERDADPTSDRAVIASQQGQTPIDIGSADYPSALTNHIYDAYTDSSKGKSLPRILDMGDYGDVHIGKPQTKVFGQGGSEAIQDGIPSLEIVPEVTVANNASGLSLKMSTNHALIRSYTGYVSRDWGHTDVGFNGTTDLQGTVAQSAISLVTPSMSGVWTTHPDIPNPGPLPSWAGTTDGTWGTYKLVEDKDEFLYPLGSGSEIVLDIDIDTHTTTGPTATFGRSDFGGVYISVTTPRHVPNVFYSEVHNTDTGRYYGNTGSLDGNSREGFARISVESSDTYFIFDEFGEVVGTGSNPMHNKLFIDQRYVDRSEVENAFDSKGLLDNTNGVLSYYETPSIVTSHEYVFGGPGLAYQGQIRPDASWDVDSTLASDFKASIPSGIHFTSYKLDDYAPASGSLYSVPLWSKMKTEMDDMATRWANMYRCIAQDDPFTTSTISQRWKNAFRNAPGAEVDATPTFGIEDNEDWFEIGALTINQVAILGSSHVSNLGYQLRSVRYKFPEILGPSGLQ